MPNATLAAGVRPDELDGDPDEEQAPDDLKEWDLEERADDRDEDQAKRDRPHRAPNLTEQTLVLGQGAHGQGDDQGVVPRQEQVERADAEEADPELRVGEDRHQVSRGEGA